ncbi:MAG: hypothetical protein JW709_01745 [Sedimentisphaerales bacterium]|nr:hypothetical protein [Sedimentisphaerales bacterium]
MTEDLVLLLNAYLDGELPPDQTQTIEEQLVHDAEARQLLGELRQVRQMVAATPRRQVPAGFTDQVQIALEREALLGQEELRAETVGRNHLRLRRTLAAAAMFILVGAIVYIVYLVLYVPAEQPTPENIPIVSNSSNHVENPNIFDIPKPDALASSSPLVSAAAQPPQTVELVWSTDDIQSERQHVNNRLIAHGINTFISVPQDDGAWQLSFVCSSETLGKLINQWRGENPMRLALILPNPMDEEPLRMPAPDKDQVLTAAHWSNTFTATDASNNSPAFIAKTENLLPAWIQQNPSKPSPMLPDLHLLGASAPANEQTPLAGSPPVVQANTGETSDTPVIIAVTLIIEPASTAISSPPEPTNPSSSPLPPVSSQPSQTPAEIPDLGSITAQ